MKADQRFFPETYDFPDDEISIPDDFRQGRIEGENTVRCPYPHEIPVELSFGKDPFTSCIDGCHQLSFLCPKCGESNRILARFCRGCSQRISFENIQEDVNKHLVIDASTTDLHAIHSINLSDRGAERVTATFSFKGYLIVGTKGAGLVVYNAFEPNTAIHHFDDFHSETVLDIREVKDQEGSPPTVLVTTDMSVYLLYMMPQFQLKQLYKVNHDGAIQYAVLHLPKNLFVFQTSAGNRPIKFIQKDIESFKEVRILENELEFSDTMIARPIEMKDRKFFLYTQEKCWIYDPVKKTVVKSRALEFPLDPCNIPVFHPRRDEIYIPGPNAIYRCKLSEDRLIPLPLGQCTFHDFRFSISPDGESLYIAHGKCFSIVDAISGHTKWDAYSQLFIGNPSGFFPPLKAGEYVIFVSRSRFGHCNVTFFSTASHDMIPFGKYHDIPQQPAIILNRLFVPTSERGKIELKVFEIK
ncbi:MAG: hypothetical protein SVY10_19220 [Thermodesulfobacteriota bacterium]|nr:hypothetical protein [Thermodesulfobacteriota bacterium]